MLSFCSVIEFNIYIDITAAFTKFTRMNRLDETINSLFYEFAAR